MFALENEQVISATWKTTRVLQKNTMTNSINSSFSIHGTDNHAPVPEENPSTAPGLPPPTPPGSQPIYQERRGQSTALALHALLMERNAPDAKNVRDIVGDCRPVLISHDRMILPRQIPENLLMITAPRAQIAGQTFGSSRREPLDAQARFAEKFGQLLESHKDETYPRLTADEVEELLSIHPSVSLLDGEGKKIPVTFNALANS